MATTKANLICNEFRRDVADNYNASTGAAISDIASEDGNEWSVSELEDLLAQAINEYQIRLAGEINAPPAVVGTKLAEILPEYVDREKNTIPVMNVPGYWTGNYGEVDLPADYAWFATFAVLNGSDYRRARYCGPAKFGYIASGRNKEYRDAYFTIDGGKIRVVSPESGIAGDQTEAELTYVHTQPAITLVTGAGGTDIPLRAHHKAGVLSIMKTIALRYKAQ